jgi:hypothetical protein
MLVVLLVPQHLAPRISFLLPYLFILYVFIIPSPLNRQMFNASRGSSVWNGVGHYVAGGAIFRTHSVPNVCPGVSYLCR